MTILLFHGPRVRRVLPLFRTCNICGSAVQREAEKTTCTRCRRDLAAAAYRFDPEAAKARWREWRNANLERQRERTRLGMAAWAATHREEHRARVRAWIRANPEKRREQHHRRRALERGAPGVGYTTAAAIATRFEYHGNRCAYCRRSGKMVVEHVIPLSRGGAHLPANIVPACVTCNSSKSYRKPSEWQAAVKTADRGSGDPPASRTSDR